MNAPAEVRSQGITSILRGGLGNQLFQYAAGRSVAERLQCPLFFEVSQLGFSLLGNTPRDFALEWQIKPKQILSAGHGAKAFKYSRHILEKLSPASGTGIFQEAGFPYNNQVLNIQIGTTLSGYFQSWRYFDDIASSLRLELLQNSPRSTWFDKTMLELEASGPYIAAHVRRGDYMKSRNAKYHGILGPLYYKTALDTLKNRGVKGRLALFSDEPEFAVEVLGGDVNDAYVVKPPKNAHPMESITLMSGGCAVVTANSSFSWWGAWLGDPTRTTVISPTPWLSNRLLDDRDVCPTNWLKVPSNFSER